MKDPNLRVFVVWEPVLLTDVGAPLSAILGRVHDVRAAQFWDPGRQLSVVLQRVRPGKEHATVDSDEIVWDFVGLYPAGVRWDTELPWPAFSGYPVFQAVDDLQRRLAEPVR